VPDDRVTVIDLKDRKILDTLNTGSWRRRISISKDGKRALRCQPHGRLDLDPVDRRQAGEGLEDRAADEGGHLAEPHGRGRRMHRGCPHP